MGCFCNYLYVYRAEHNSRTRFYMNPAEPAEWSCISILIPVRLANNSREEIHAVDRLQFRLSRSTEIYQPRIITFKAEDSAYAQWRLDIQHLFVEAEDPDPQTVLAMAETSPYAAAALNVATITRASLAERGLDDTLAYIRGLPGLQPDAFTTDNRKARFIRSQLALQIAWLREFPHALRWEAARARLDIPDGNYYGQLHALHMIAGNRRQRQAYVIEQTLAFVEGTGTPPLLADQNLRNALRSTPNRDHQPNNYLYRLFRRINDPVHAETLRMRFEELYPNPGSDQPIGIAIDTLIIDPDDAEALHAAFEKHLASLQGSRSGNHASMAAYFSQVALQNLHERGTSDTLLADLYYNAFTHLKQATGQLQHSSYRRGQYQRFLLETLKVQIEADPEKTAEIADVFITTVNEANHNLNANSASATLDALLLLRDHPDRELHDKLLQAFLPRAGHHADTEARFHQEYPEHAP